MLQAVPVIHLLQPQLIVLCLQLQQPVPLLKDVRLRAAQRLFGTPVSSSFNTAQTKDYRCSLMFGMKSMYVLYEV